MNPGEGKIYVGAAILGIAVFHGLSLLGVGTDFFAEWIATLDPPIRPDSASKAVLGVLAATSIFLLTDGYLTASEGAVISHTKNW
jgi:hypothetical protein